MAKIRRALIKCVESIAVWNRCLDSLSIVPIITRGSLVIIRVGEFIGLVVPYIKEMQYVMTYPLMPVH